MYRIAFWTLWEKVRVGLSANSIETCVLSYVKHSQSRFDAWDRVLRAGALGCPRGMGKEAGGGFRMGNTCKSMADSCQCMAKTTTIL